MQSAARLGYVTCAQRSGRFYGAIVGRNHASYAIHDPALRVGANPSGVSVGNADHVNDVADTKLGHTAAFIAGLEIARTGTLQESALHVSQV
jgi:hypothetical protein